MKYVEYPEPEWNAQNINRKSGDTNFSICGWCQYTSGGSCRYSCTLSGSCSFLDEMYYYDFVKKIGKEIHWDTKCKLLQLSQDDMKDWTNAWYYKIQQAQSALKRVEKERQAIIELTEKLEKRPPLAEFRESDFFKNNECIRIFAEDKQLWLKATVVPGYRSGDGCVSYIIDSVPESQTKGPWGCGNAVPIVIHEWEYQYFKNNPKFWKWWKQQVEAKEYNGDHIALTTLSGEL